MVGTVPLCGYCGRPCMQEVAPYIMGGDARTYHRECVAPPGGSGRLDDLERRLRPLEGALYGIAGMKPPGLPT